MRVGGDGQFGDDSCLVRARPRSRCTEDCGRVPGSWKTVPRTALEASSQGGQTAGRRDMRASAGGEVYGEVEAVTWVPSALFSLFRADEPPRCTGSEQLQQKPTPRR